MSIQVSLEVVPLASVSAREVACGIEEGQSSFLVIGGHPMYEALRYEWQVGSLGEAWAHHKPQSKGVESLLSPRLALVALSHRFFFIGAQLLLMGAT